MGLTGHQVLMLYFIPMSGPRLQIAIAAARSRSEKRSPTEPPPIPTGALPVNPAKIQIKNQLQPSFWKTYQGNER